jgi:hypothetical protein
MSHNIQLLFISGFLAIFHLSMAIAEIVILSVSDSISICNYSISHNLLLPCITNISAFWLYSMLFIFSRDAEISINLKLLYLNITNLLVWVISLVFTVKVPYNCMLDDYNNSHVQLWNLVVAENSLFFVYSLLNTCVFLWAYYISHTTTQNTPNIQLNTVLIDSNT